jgi:hypothetical protein
VHPHGVKIQNVLDTTFPNLSADSHGRDTNEVFTGLVHEYFVAELSCVSLDVCIPGRRPPFGAEGK